MREQNIFSNRCAPSRDIAKKFASLEGLRFICEGGYYEENSVYKQ